MPAQLPEPSLRSRSDIEDEDNVRLSRAQAVALQEPSISRSLQTARSYRAPLWAKRLMSGTKTEICFGLLVLANGIVIGYETEWAANHITVGWPEVFDLAIVTVITTTSHMPATYQPAGLHAGPTSRTLPAQPQRH
mmetsp:Transcript_67903/g.147954  ORF Transcript_67903/g.147954 Transcript_67903/m.147954 type:complete len:136 (-) Transcript_67903:233-640(-)